MYIYYDHVRLVKQVHEKKEGVPEGGKFFREKYK
jgi:hypothetical protein